MLFCSNYQYIILIFHSVCSSEYHQQLSLETFELDLIEEEKLQQIAVNSANNNNYVFWLEGPWSHPPSSPFQICGSGTPLSRRGYLYKGTFPQDGGISVSMKVVQMLTIANLYYFFIELS